LGVGDTVGTGVGDTVGSGVGSRVVGVFVGSRVGLNVTGAKVIGLSVVGAFVVGSFVVVRGAPTGDRKSDGNGNAGIGIAGTLLGESSKPWTETALNNAL